MRRPSSPTSANGVGAWMLKVPRTKPSCCTMRLGGGSGVVEAVSGALFVGAVASATVLVGAVVAVVPGVSVVVVATAGASGTVVVVVGVADVISVDGAAAPCLRYCA